MSTAASPNREEDNKALLEVQAAVERKMEKEFSDYVRETEFLGYMVGALVLMARGRFRARFVKATITQVEQFHLACVRWGESFLDLYARSSRTGEALRWIRARLDSINSIMHQEENNTLVQYTILRQLVVDPRFEAQVLRNGYRILSEQDFWLAELKELFDDFVKKDIKEAHENVASDVQNDYVSHLSKLLLLDNRSPETKYNRLIWLQVYRELRVLLMLVQQGHKVFSRTGHIALLFEPATIKTRMRSWIPPDNLVRKEIRAIDSQRQADSLAKFEPVARRRVSRDLF